MDRKKLFIIIDILGIICVIILCYVTIILPVLFNNPLMQDYAQDYIGARALLNHTKDLYPVLSDAFKDIGINWSAAHLSTHPPTAFLFALPLSFLPIGISTYTWMVLMLVCIILTAWAIGMNWKWSILIGVLSLAWPPTIWSLGQLTPIWLLGLVLAYKYREQPIRSGIFMALASLPKFLAAPALFYYVKHKKWSAFAGFFVVWFIAIAILLLIRPDSISTYISVNTHNSVGQVFRQDNGALFIVAWRLGQWVGIAIVISEILWVLWSFHKSNGINEWACIVWLGIALLPISWTYSLLPLLPWLLLTILHTKSFSRTFGIVALLLPYAAPVPTANPTIIALTIIVSGLSFCLGTKPNNAELSQSNTSSLLLTN